MRSRPAEIVLFLACTLLLALPSQAQTIAEASPRAKGPTAPSGPAAVSTAEATSDEAERERVNKWTIGLSGGTIDAAYLKFAADISSALDDGDNLRVFPIVTKGSVQNVYDLLYLRGIDIGLVGADTFGQLKKEGKIKNLENRIQYISQIHISSFQIVARAEIKTLKDLEGKKLAVPVKGATATVLAQKILARNGVKAELVEIGITGGVEKVKTGEVDAVAGGFAVGGPTIYSNLPNNLGLHIVSVPFDKFLDEYYAPVTLEHGDYPNLIPSGERVETIGTPVVLAVYNWDKGTERFRKVERFVQYYFDRIEKLKNPPYQPQWKAVNLAASVPGWKRYWYAQEVLDKHLALNSDANQLQLSATDQQTLSAMPEEQKRRFREFLEWKKKNPLGKQ